MINNIKEKIKSWENEIFLVAVIVLLTISVIGALRLFLLKPKRPAITIQENAFSITGGGDSRQSLLGGEASHLFMASKNGTKYYPVDCEAGNRIKPENRIYFASAINAQKAGYERTVSCKP